MYFFCGSLCYLCLVFVILLRLFFAALWSPAGKGLSSWLLFVMSNCDFVTSSCGILDQVRYLVVLIPDLCRLSYFYTKRAEVCFSPCIIFASFCSKFIIVGFFCYVF